MLDKISVVLLTLNEEVNIGRALDKLTWAKGVVVVDSYSTDSTEQLCRNYKNVRFFQRKFDSHSAQWNYAIRETGIATEWVLALDADYMITPSFVKELSSLTIDTTINACFARFDFAIHGRVLPSSVYPPVAVLFRKEKALYVQDGHTQRLSFEGNSLTFASRIILDDRKSIYQWVQSQNRYAKLEAEKLCSAKLLTIPDKLRKMIFPAPFIILIYCLFVKRALLCGWEGIYYTLQRVAFETILSLYLVERKILKKTRRK